MTHRNKSKSSWIRHWVFCIQNITFGTKTKIDIGLDFDLDISLKTLHVAPRSIFRLNNRKKTNLIKKEKNEQSATRDIRFKFCSWYWVQG